jgi:hypothetical protein
VLGAAMSATPGQTTSYEGKCIMAAKKKTSTTADAGLQTPKIGSRVRCTDDRIEGRIVWANGVSVKIKWNDGEQVTWRRDSLASRPIEIMADDDDAAAPAAEQTEPGQAADETTVAAPEATTELITPTPEPEVATEAQPPASASTEASTDPTPPRKRRPLQMSQPPPLRRRLLPPPRTRRQDQPMPPQQANLRRGQACPSGSGRQRPNRRTRSSAPWTLQPRSWPRRTRR